jgi:hypothetical protein
MRLPRPTALLALALAPLLSACGYLGPRDCTDEARSSVVVSVVDASGAAVHDAVVRFSIDGGAEEMAQCMPISGGGGGTPIRCENWIAGWERGGNYTIKVESPDGTRRAEQQLTVTEDECHVKTEQVTLTLR